MFKYIIRRILLMIPTFFGVTFLVFFILQKAPDGPFDRAIKQLKNQQMKRIKEQILNTKLEVRQNEMRHECSLLIDLIFT